MAIVDYLVCYDISDAKRLRKVAKVVYSYAIGGQKSALEVPASRTELESLIGKLDAMIDHDQDRIHIVRFIDEPILLGCADFLGYDEGMVIV